MRGQQIPGGSETLEDVLFGGGRAGRRPPADLEAEGVEGEDGVLVRHSVKRRFQALALGPVLEYGAEFTILQFVFDLHLWSDLGSKKNLGYTVPMRVMMKGNSFSPLYWKEVHFTLLDAVRQLGYPKVFFTLAPCSEGCHGQAAQGEVRASGVRRTCSCRQCA